jgi:hypothetical protein
VWLLSGVGVRSGRFVVLGLEDSVAKILNEFKAFVLRGNVVDLAIAVVVGGAFSGIVTLLRG